MKASTALYGVDTKRPKVEEIAVMSAILSFNSGAASRLDVRKAADIPGGELTLKGCSTKDKRILHSIRKSKLKEKQSRKKIREAKLATNQGKGQTSYASWKFNEVDPLDYVVSSSDDEDYYPLARVLVDDESEDCGDSPLANFIQKRQQK